MKKIIFILFLLLFFMNRKEDVIPTFNELTYIPIKMVCIDVTDENITTKNLLSIIPKKSIISVKPYINSVVNNKYDVPFSSLESIIDNYKNNADKYGYTNWYSKIYLGIKLEKIKIMMDQKSLEDLFSKHKKIKLCYE